MDQPSAERFKEIASDQGPRIFEQNPTAGVGQQQGRHHQGRMTAGRDENLVGMTGIAAMQCQTIGDDLAQGRMARRIAVAHVVAPACRVCRFTFFGQSAKGNWS